MMNEFLSIIGTIALLYVGSTLFWSTIKMLADYFPDADIRYLIALGVGVVAILFFATLAHATECLPSAPAVWAEHPGAHAYWHIRDGQKCWDTIPAKGKPPASRIASGQRGREVVSGSYGRASAKISANRETTTEIPGRDSYTDVALSMAVAPPSRERTVIDLLTEMGWCDYLIRLNRLVDIVHERGLREADAN